MTSFVGQTRRRQQGVTLLELLIVLALTVVLASASCYAMMAEVQFQRLHEQRRGQQDSIDATEREITRLLKGAKFTPSTTATGTTTVTATTTSTSVGTTTYFQGINDGRQSLTGCDRLTFTSTAPGVPQASMYSTDDFQTQHDARGPVGGVSEISIGLQPVGTPSAGQSGLFERSQTPSDTDPTQGGNEWVLDPNIDEIGFQFWDGLEWQPTWDTTNGQTQLPQAVQVTYTVKNEAGSPQHLFVVAIPGSTINAQNPATSTVTSTGTTGATGGAAGGAGGATP
jgi:prepilin-type N-terminal cleavage/methylation domain-containing protein